MSHRPTQFVTKYFITHFQQQGIILGHLQKLQFTAQSCLYSPCVPDCHRIVTFLQYFLAKTLLIRMHSLFNVKASGLVIACYSIIILLL